MEKKVFFPNICLNCSHFEATQIHALTGNLSILFQNFYTAKFWTQPLFLIFCVCQVNEDSMEKMKDLYRNVITNTIKLN